MIYMYLILKHARWDCVINSSFICYDVYIRFWFALVHWCIPLIAIYQSICLIIYLSIYPCNIFMVFTIIMTCGYKYYFKKSVSRWRVIWQFDESYLISFTVDNHINVINCNYSTTFINIWNFLSTLSMKQHCKVTETFGVITVDFCRRCLFSHTCIQPLCSYTSSTLTNWITLYIK